MSSSKRITIFKPFKIQSSKNTPSKCQICLTNFQTLVKKQYVCSRCKRSICEKCSPKKIKVFMPEGISSLNRCCLICIKQSESIDFLIRSSRLVFAQDSLHIDEWIKKLNRQKISYQQIMNQFKEKIYQTNANIIKFKSESDKIFEQLFPSYNYSLRQLIGTLTDEISNQFIKQKIANVCIAVYSYLKDIPYIYELIYFIQFLLCFANEFHTYFLITRLIEKIYPQYLRIDRLKKDNFLTHEMKMLIDMYKMLAGRIEKQQLDLVAQYLQSLFTQFIKSFTVNLCNVSVSFYIIDEMFKNTSYIYFYKSVISLFYSSRELINNSRTPEEIQYFILKNCTLDQVKNLMIVFEKSNAKFEMDHQFFDSAEHRKLNQKYKQLDILYQKSQQKFRNLDSKHRLLVKDYEGTQQKLTEVNSQFLELQQQFLKYSDRLISLQEIERYNEENLLLNKRNSYLNQQINKLKKMLEDKEKEYFLKESNYRIFLKLQQSYKQQIVQLKTKNQIYQIQKMANDINFNTSIIQQKINSKNQKILELESRIAEIQIQLQFYKKNRNGQYSVNKEETNYFNSSESQINRNNESWRINTSLNLSTQINKQEKDNFKKYIDMSRETIEKLKLNLEQSEKRKQLLEQDVKRLTQIINNQKKQIQLNKQINHFVNQIPEEIDYASHMNDLEQIISKESNIHRKTQLQKILWSFKKCIYEVRYRAIDAKLKQNQISSNNFGNILQIGTDDESLIDEGQKGLNDILEWIGNEQILQKSSRVENKNQECMMM